MSTLVYFYISMKEIDCNSVLWSNSAVSLLETEQRIMVHVVLAAGIADSAI